MSQYFLSLSRLRGLQCDSIAMQSHALDLVGFMAAREEFRVLVYNTLIDFPFTCKLDAMASGGS